MFLAPEFVSHNTLDVRIVGPREYGGAVANYRAAFPDLHTTLEEVLVDGDRVVVRGTDRGTHRGDFMGFPASGREVTTTWIEIFRMENGKAAEGWLDRTRRSSAPSSPRSRAERSPGSALQSQSGPPTDEFCSATKS